MSNNPYQNPYTGLGAIWETQEQLRKQSEANIRQATAMANKAQAQAGKKVFAPISQPPPRPMTQEERAEAARQRSNFSIITKKVSVWQHLTGMVISYLDADGALLADANGDLLNGEAVTR